MKPPYTIEQETIDSTPYVKFFDGREPTFGYEAIVYFLYQEVARLTEEASNGRELQ